MLKIHYLLKLAQLILAKSTSWRKSLPAKSLLTNLKRTSRRIVKPSGTHSLSQGKSMTSQNFQNYFTRPLTTIESCQEMKMMIKPTSSRKVVHRVSILT